MFPFVEGVLSDPPSSIDSDITLATYNTCANAGAHDEADRSDLYQGMGRD